MLNWIVWNRTVLTFNYVLMVDGLFEIELFLHLTVCKQNLYLCYAKLFEIELFICIKMDLALNNLQWLTCHKTKANQTKMVTLLVEFEFWKREKDRWCKEDGVGNSKLELTTSASENWIMWMGMLSYYKGTSAHSFRLQFNLIVLFSCLNSDELFCPLLVFFPFSRSSLIIYVFRI